MKEGTKNSSATGTPVEVNGIVSHLSTREEVERFAMEGNHALLYRSICCYKNGDMTWEQAMQYAALNQAVALEDTKNIALKMLERTPMNPIIFKG